MDDISKKIIDKRTKAEKKLGKLRKTIDRCPFCGSTADIFNVGYGSGNYGSGSKLVIRCLNSNCNIAMEGPDTSWQDIDSYIDKVPEFIKKWNTRV